LFFQQRTRRIKSLTLREFTFVPYISPVISIKNFTKKFPNDFCNHAHQYMAIQKGTRVLKKTRMKTIKVFNSAKNSSVNFARVPFFSYLLPALKKMNPVPKYLVRVFYQYKNEHCVHCYIFFIFH